MPKRSSSELNNAEISTPTTTEHKELSSPLPCETEPLLTPDHKRFVLFPIKKKEVWQYYKKAEASFWTTSEIDLTQDVKDWEKLNSDEQKFIKHVLAFFAASDGIVAENLAMRFLKEIQCAEVRCFYGFQIAMENIHNETYSLLIDTYIRCESEKKRLFEAMDTIPCIKKKAEWALRWISDSNAAFAERLVAFAVVEGIFFSGSFCAIFWIKRKNLMPGLTFANELISRDEGLHTNFACLLYSELQQKLELSVVHKIFADAVAVEKEFVCDALQIALIGMNADTMGQYIEYVADRLLVALGYAKLFNGNSFLLFLFLCFACLCVFLLSFFFILFGKKKLCGKERKKTLLFICDSDIKFQKQKKMDRPLQCFVCGEPLLGRYYDTYMSLIKKGVDSEDAIDKIEELDLLCCRVMILSHNPRLAEQFYLKPQSELVPEPLPENLNMGNNKSDLFSPGGKRHLDADKTSMSFTEFESIAKKHPRKKQTPMTT